VSKPLRILHLEDDPDYSDLVRTLLVEEKVCAEFVLVNNRADFESQLGQTPFDLILADHRLPGYTGIEALRTARLRCPDVPFLLVSGTLSEQAAIESLKGGATDYVLKQCTERLVPAVRRAAQEAEERAHRRRVETELIRREKYFRALTENALDILTVLNRDAQYLYNSPSLRRMLGYDPRELMGESPFSRIHPDDLPLVRLKFAEILNSQERLTTLEYRFQHKDGTWRWLEGVGQNRLADPEIGGVVINSRDISDRKQTEHNLRESEKQYRLIFDGNPTPMWVFDQETLEFLEVNDAAVQYYGYSRDEFLRLKITDIRPDQDVPVMLEYLHTLVNEESAPRMGLAGVWRHLKKDGALIDVEIKWCPISFRGRRASLTMANDVTERKRTEHRDAAFSKLGQNLSSATSPVEAAQIIQSVANELFQWDAFTLDVYSAEEDQVFPTLSVDTERSGRKYEITDGKQWRPLTARARRILEGGAELILREEPLSIPPDALPIGDASRPSASLMVVPIRNRTKTLGILSLQSYTPRAYTQQDLDTLQMLADHCGGALERMRAEQALHESEQRFRDLFEGSPDAIFVYNLEGQVLDVNPAACHLHGMRRAELIGKNLTELVPSDQRGEVARNFPTLVAGDKRQVEGISLTADGRLVPVEVRASRVEYSGQSAVLLHVRDITERKYAEAALRSSEMLFHSVWENSADGMRLTDEDGIIVAVNDAFCRLVGFKREELEGKPFSVLYADSEDPGTLLEAYRKRVRDRLMEQHSERRLKLRNGAEICLEDTSSYVELRGQPPLVLGLFRDVTAQKRLEDQLRQSQKMDAIGQLAGGVAHDFNNILTVIQGHASLLQAGTNLTGFAARSAQQIGQAADRAATLTRQLLTFSRRQVMQPRRLDMNEVVGNMTKMLGRILGEDVTLQLNYAPQPALVEADAGMIEQVLLNLAVNSRDAMPKGGSLTIRISRQMMDAVHLARHAEARAGSFVCLAVSDTGCGIAPVNLPRIYEPFFTTKEVGKGTGLGLATVYGIVKQHQGWIEVESELGHGATFRVYLPCGTHKPGVASEDPGEQTATGGTETILVVEDEASVRELVCSLLASHGYKILQAESGPQAVRVWQEHKEKVDLLLTDLVMPDHMNGRELAEKLWSDRPHLRVLFTSGYSADVVGKDFVLRRGLNYLQKPYHPNKLALAVRECLDARN
jgi:PAS domain S-box-containing protein